MNFKASKQGPEDGSEEYRIEIKFQLATTDSIEVNIYWKNILVTHLQRKSLNSTCAKGKSISIKIVLFQIKCWNQFALCYIRE